MSASAMETSQHRACSVQTTCARHRQPGTQAAAHKHAQVKGRHTLVVSLIHVGILNCASHESLKKVAQGLRSRLWLFLHIYSILASEHAWAAARKLVAYTNYPAELSFKQTGWSLVLLGALCFIWLLSSGALCYPAAQLLSILSLCSICKRLSF